MDPLARNFAANVRVLRITRKLTQSQLARRLGITASYVSHVEGGHGSPQLATVSRFAKALKVRPLYLLQDNDVEDLGGDLRYATGRRRRR